MIRAELPGIDPAEGATESDIAATYEDGILEVRIPVAARPPEAQPTRIAITRG